MDASKRKTDNLRYELQLTLLVYYNFIEIHEPHKYHLSIDRYIDPNENEERENYEKIFPSNTGSMMRSRDNKEPTCTPYNRNLQGFT